MSLKPRGLYASYVAREKGTARKHNEVCRNCIALALASDGTRTKVRLLEPVRR
jgi:hypothetical protein